MIGLIFFSVRGDPTYVFRLSKSLNSGHLRVLKNCPLLRGVRYWEVILKRLSHLGVNVLTAIHGMSAIWDAHHWEFSRYTETDSIVIQPSAPNFFTSVSSRVLFFTYFSDQNKGFYSLIVKL